ncbi:hypothetical protein GIB67_039784 [Kingdonia uniflora]|uniref:Uncharacterized protein n=1 Tax=Kingdonia uniflora TaxID=39325 RepID=A0A7J7P3E0_9MAGN|nr:hypothetical protein GIB67_039784 [Kingdonia uniflora]
MKSRFKETTALYPISNSRNVSLEIEKPNWAMILKASRMITKQECYYDYYLLPQLIIAQLDLQVHDRHFFSICRASTLMSNGFIRVDCFGRLNQMRHDVRKDLATYLAAKGAQEITPSLEGQGIQENCASKWGLFAIVSLLRNRSYHGRIRLSRFTRVGGQSLSLVIRLIETLKVDASVDLRYHILEDLWLWGHNILLNAAMIRQGVRVGKDDIHIIEVFNFAQFIKEMLCEVFKCLSGEAFIPFERAINEIGRKLVIQDVIDSGMQAERILKLEDIRLWVGIAIFADFGGMKV